MIQFKKKRILFLAGAVLFLLSIGAGSAWYLFGSRPLQTTKDTYIYIDGDDTADSVFIKLESYMKDSRMPGMKILSFLYDYSAHIHPGAYKLNAQNTTWHIFHRLRQGMQTPVRLTVPSVRTTGRLAKTVSRQIMADSASIALLLNDSSYCARLGYNVYTLPTLFIPNTYEVYWTLTPEQFMERMQKEYKRFWNKERMEKAQRIGLTPTEVTTLASIVEEETALKTEKPIVAGLYINRLHRGMPLQADPTVKFALQDFTLRRILHKHLECESPYNTYKHIGLPPGPIRIPSIDGIESVLNYTPHKYLYMCAREDFSGYHNFAETMTQHLQNAARYQRELNKRNIR